MTDVALIATVERVATHDEGLEYELKNYERAQEVGSYESAERALARAANHAAILTALRAQMKEDGRG